MSNCTIAVQHTRASVSSIAISKLMKQISGQEYLTTATQMPQRRVLLDYELGVLRVVCNANPDRKVLVEKNYPDTQFTTDFEELLQRSDIGAVATSTQTVYHYDILKMALMNDKDTVVEKPLALTVAEGS